MKIFKVVGIVFIIAAILCALFVVLRIDTEEQKFQSGEITLSEMTSDTSVMTWIGGAVCVGVLGAICLLIQFMIDNSHLPLLSVSTKNRRKHELIDDLLSDKYNMLRQHPDQIVPLDDNDYIGGFEIDDVPLALHCTSNGIYVITSVDNPADQYWCGTISGLHALEVSYDHKK